MTQETVNNDMSLGMRQLIIAATTLVHMDMTYSHQKMPKDDATWQRLIDDLRIALHNVTNN